MKRRIQQLVIIVCTVTGFFLSSTPTLAAEHATLVKHPPVGTANAYYVGNRAPLRPSPLIALPMKSIQARGWLRKQLELQGAGFLGSLGDISRFMGKEGNAWLSRGKRRSRLGRGALLAQRVHPDGLLAERPGDDQ